MYYAGQYRDAADVLGGLVAKPEFADRTDLLMAAGDCQMRLGRFHDAMNDLQAAAAAEAQFAHDLDQNRGGRGNWQLGDRQLDLQIAVNKAIDLDANNPRAELILGYLRLRQNRLGRSRWRNFRRGRGRLSS